MYQVLVYWGFVARVFVPSLVFLFVLVALCVVCVFGTAVVILGLLMAPCNVSNSTFS